MVNYRSLEQIQKDGLQEFDTTPAGTSTVRGAAYRTSGRRGMMNP
jgi:hypothetical protein